MGIRVFIVGYAWNVKSHFSAKQGFLVTHSWLGQVLSFSHEIIDWPDCHFCPIVLQLSWPFSSPACYFGDLPVVSQSRDPVSRFLWLHTSWVFFTHSHTQPLHKSHLNTGYLIAKLQVNLAWNKANTWLNKFNLTNFSFMQGPKQILTKTYCIFICIKQKSLLCI